MIMRFMFGKAKVAVTIEDGKFKGLNSVRSKLGGEFTEMTDLVKRSPSTMKKIEHAAMLEFSDRTKRKMRGFSDDDRRTV